MAAHIRPQVKDVTVSHPEQRSDANRSIRAPPAWPLRSLQVVLPFLFSRFHQLSHRLPPRRFHNLMGMLPCGVSRVGEKATRFTFHPPVLSADKRKQMFCKKFQVLLMEKHPGTKQAS